MNGRTAWMILGVAGAAISMLACPAGAPAADPHGTSSPAVTKPAAKPASPKPAASSHAEPREPAAGPGTKVEPGKPAPRQNSDKAAPSQPDDHGDTGASSVPFGESSGPVTAAQALALLREGNARWVSGATLSPNSGSDRRTEVADKGQTPFATILTCSDSRLPVERLFDRGVGDVFVVRVAGNIAGASEAGTLEYGLGHLHTPLLVVMGHTRCGAVAAAASGAEVHGNVKSLVDAIAPAVERARRFHPELSGPELAAAAVKENVWQTVFDLYRASPEIRALVGQGKVTVVGAVCDISTGKVEWMGEHPWQSELLEALRARDASKASATAEPAPAGH
ncbi:MAG: hypothetical protein KIT68_03380 [Phycisphaeraceae bacterium]|nr:hypothetical protein [Phycisphaeraceae bacterium]